MAVAVAQQSAALDLATEPGTRSLTSVAAARRLVALWITREGTDLGASGVSDGINGAYSAIFKSGATSGRRVAAHQFANCASGNPTVSVDLSAADANLGVTFVELSGAATSASGDVLGSGNIGGTAEQQNFGTTSHSCGTITAPGAGIIICVAAFNSNLTETPHSGFTALNNGSRWYLMYKVTTGESITPTITTASSGDSTCFCFFIAADAGGGASITGSGAVTGSVATASGSGAHGHDAISANPTSVFPTVAGAGVKGVTGTGALTNPKPTILSVTGSAVSGTGAATIQPITSAGTASRGAVDVPGPIAITSNPVAAISGTGIIGVPRTASGALTAPRATAAGIAGRSWAGTGALTIQPPTVSGNSFISRALTGTGALVAPIALIAGITVKGHVGTGAITSSKASLVGTGLGVLVPAENPTPAHTAACLHAIRHAHGKPSRWPR